MSMRDIARLETELKERQEGFIRRERVYRMRLTELTQELADLRKAKTRWMDDDPNVRALRETHGAIISQVSAVQHHTVSMVAEQERDMLSAFRGRLHDVQRELEMEKEKKDDGAAAWIERTRKLELDVDREKERADKLDRVNQALGQENGRLKMQFETQEDDRAFLLRQLVSVKSQNATNRETITNKQFELDALGLAPPAEPALPALDDEPARHAAAPPPPSSRPSADGAFRDMALKLTKMLDTERKHVAQVKSAHEEWARLRTPLELKLRDAVAQVAAVVQHRQQQSGGGGGGGAQAAPPARRHRPSHIAPRTALDVNLLASFHHDDREKAIELWLSMDGVLDSLYDESDVHAQSAPPKSLHPAANATLSPADPAPTKLSLS